MEKIIVLAMTLMASCMGQRTLPTESEMMDYKLGWRMGYARGLNNGITHDPPEWREAWEEDSITFIDSFK